MAHKVSVIAKARASGGTRNSRVQLLDAASALLRERNGVEAPVADIAERAEVNPGLISYHFGSKDGLLVALLERDMSKGLVQLQELVNAPISASSKIRIHISGLINLFHRYPYLNQLLLTIIGRSSPEQAAQLTDRLVKPIVDAHRKLLEEGVASGEFRSVDPMFFYYTVLGSCDRIFAARYTLDKVFNVHHIDEALKKRFVEHTVSILTLGLSQNLPEASENDAAGELGRVGGVPSSDGSI